MREWTHRTRDGSEIQKHVKTCAKWKRFATNDACMLQQNSLLWTKCVEENAPSAIFVLILLPMTYIVDPTLAEYTDGTFGNGCVLAISTHARRPVHTSGAEWSSFNQCPCRPMQVNACSSQLVRRVRCILHCNCAINSGSRANTVREWFEASKSSAMRRQQLAFGFEREHRKPHECLICAHKSFCFLFVRRTAASNFSLSSRDTTKYKLYSVSPIPMRIFILILFPMDIAYPVLKPVKCSVRGGFSVQYKATCYAHYT